MSLLDANFVLSGLNVLGVNEQSAFENFDKEQLVNTNAALEYFFDNNIREVPSMIDPSILTDEKLVD